MTMQLNSLELDVLGVVAAIELKHHRMARFDDAQNRRACHTLDELGLVSMQDGIEDGGQASTIACMRDQGRDELRLRGFYRSRQ